ncbi:uncharacterized protein LOC107634477 [Arachis ipaensis]|uniref:uncharacterized protein LOC107634477 n=1 Tax=Arachis ipaensis TaxID=130454 RepID=UPI0007AF2176|nr:uncharacterized protein LOC107634477 [Arachis ipaensis]
MTTTILILEENRSRSCHHHSSPRFTSTAFLPPSSRLCLDPSRCVVASGLSPPFEIRCSRVSAYASVRVALTVRVISLLASVRVVQPCSSFSSTESSSSEWIPNRR